MRYNGKESENFPTFHAFHEVIHFVLRRADNTKDIAVRLGKTPTAVDQWGNDPDISKHPIPASKIIPFCLAANDMLPIKWLAEQTRGVYIQIPEVPKSMGAAGAEMASLAREFSDVLGAFTEVIEDGRVTAKEEAMVRKELDELIRQAVRFRRMFK